MSVFNPDKLVYGAVMEYILSNKFLAKTFKETNITRYDAPTHNQFPHKKSLSPADCPELILQILGYTSNLNSSSGYIDIYNFQATITTSAWTLDDAPIARILRDWLIESNHNPYMHGYNWGEHMGFVKCEVLPTQMANSSAELRNLSGWMYAVYFNIQVDRSIGVLTDGN